MSIENIINEVKESAKGKKAKKTKNNELYYQLVMTLCTDDDYVAKNVKEVKDGEIVTEDMKLAPEFKKIVITALKKHTTLTEAEAIEAMKEFKLTVDQAKTIASIVHEADYLATKECGKKVQLFNKPGVNATIQIDEAKETTRPHPRDKDKLIKRKKHDRVKVQQTLYDFQKEIISK